MLKIFIFLFSIHSSYPDVALKDSIDFYNSYNQVKCDYNINLLAAIAIKESRMQESQTSKDKQDIGMFQIRTKFYRDLEHKVKGSKKEQIEAVCEVLNRIKAMTRKSKRFKKRVNGKDLEGCKFRWLGNYNGGYRYYKRVCKIYRKIGGEK